MDTPEPVAATYTPREIIERAIPTAVKVSMLSYALRTDVPDAAAHKAKMIELDKWEEAVVDARNAPWPAPPEWLAEYAKSF